MKIAVTYDQGEIFQHFGKCKQFKIYEVEGNQIVSSEVVSSAMSGHSALAILLSSYNVDIIICGGIGDGARNALAQEGIQLCAGASGNADEAVQAFLEGVEYSDCSTCDHHGEDHECDCGEDEGNCHCGGGCCGHHQPTMEGVNVGKKVKVHYKGTFNDGTVFDTSYGRQPLEFVCGAGMMIRGFDQAVANMSVGEIVSIHLQPEEAYGPKDPTAIMEVEIAQLPGSEGLEVGQQVYLSNVYGQQFLVKVTAKDEKYITFDANHEMAGKELNFEIELLEIM